MKCHVVISFCFAEMSVFESKQEPQWHLVKRKKKEKQEAVFSVFLPLLKALSDDICLTLKLKNSFNPFLRQPLWRHNFAFCFQQRWHLSGVVWSHCDWIHNISQFIFFQQRLIVRARGVDLTNFKIFWSNSPGWEMKGQSKVSKKPPP